MDKELLLLGNELDTEIVFKAECSYCYNTSEVDTDSRKEAAKEFHSLGWRFANKERIGGVLVIGMVCPTCSNRMNLLTPSNDGK